MRNRAVPAQNYDTLTRAHERCASTSWRLLRSAIAFALCYSGLLSLYLAIREAVFGPRLFIFMYHRVRTKPRPRAASAIERGVHIRRFGQHIVLFQRLGPVRSVRDAWTGFRKYPRKSVVAVSFDDAYRDILPAIRLLKSRRLNCTVYAVASASGRGELLWWDRAALRRDPASGRPESGASALPIRPRPGHKGQVLYLSIAELRDLERSGVEIGGHTVTHPFLARVSQAEAEAETYGSRDFLIAKGFTWPATFAYPHGSWSWNTVRIVRHAGFVCAVTTDPGTNRASDHPFTLKRIAAGDEHVAYLAARILRADLAATLTDWTHRLARHFRRLISNPFRLRATRSCELRRPRCLQGTPELAQSRALRFHPRFRVAHMVGAITFDSEHARAP